MKPLIGVTCDLCDSPNGQRLFSYPTYGRAIESVGGVPLWLSPHTADPSDLIESLDGIVLAGGDDPMTEPFGSPSHEAITPVEPARQRFESALINACNADPDFPVLGVCLGMQMMVLHAGGMLDQHMPESHPNWQRHWNQLHPVLPEHGGTNQLKGTVMSKHRQAVTDAGSLQVIARSDDGLIEAVADSSRAFHVGVQWHPERTKDPAVGQMVFAHLVKAAMTQC